MSYNEYGGFYLETYLSYPYYVYDGYTYADTIDGAPLYRIKTYTKTDETQYYIIQQSQEVLFPENTRFRIRGVGLPYSNNYGYYAYSYTYYNYSNMLYSNWIINYYCYISYISDAMSRVMVSAGSVAGIVSQWLQSIIKRILT